MAVGGVRKGLDPAKVGLREDLFNPCNLNQKSYWRHLRLRMSLGENGAVDPQQSHRNQYRRRGQVPIWILLRHNLVRWHRYTPNLLEPHRMLWSQLRQKMWNRINLEAQNKRKSSLDPDLQKAWVHQINKDRTILRLKWQQSHRQQKERDKPRFSVCLKHLL